MGLEIWEERNGESESSSHRDESGSFSSGKNSGSNRDACLAEDTVRYRDRWLGRKTKRDMERIGGARRKYKEIFYSRLFDSDTKDFKAYDGTVRDARVAQQRRRKGRTVLALMSSDDDWQIYRYEQRSWYCSSIPQQFLPRYETRRGRARGPPVQHFRNSTPSFHVT